MCKSNRWKLLLSKEELRERAEELFWCYSGFSEQNPASSYQQEEIASVHETKLQQLQIEILVQKLEDVSFCENYMLLQGEVVYYDIPLARYKEQILGCYLFLVSEKTLATDQQDTIDQLYIHIWQNAYLDAAREWVKDWLKGASGSFVSQGVAPGFYGIDVGDMPKLFSQINGEEIGVVLREDGFLFPEKSVLGMYFTLAQDLNIFGRQCSRCLAKGKNCEFCMEKL